MPNNTVDTVFNKPRNTFLLSTPAKQSPAKDAANAQLNKKNTDLGRNNTPEEKNSSKNMLLGTLSGLAVLGGSVYWIKYRKNMWNNFPAHSGTLSNNLDVLIEEVGKLKKLIREDYLSKRQALINKMNDPGEFGFELSFKDNKDLKKKVNIIEEQYGPAAENAKKVLEENRQIIIDKLRKLSSDPEWNELKILRKKLVKTMTTSPSMDQRKIAENKIPMVNDLITNKVYPDEVENYKSMYGIDNQKISELVRKEFASYDEFVNEYTSLNQENVFDIPFMDRRFSHTSRLSFETVFPEETGIMKTCKSLIDINKARLDSAKKLYSDFNNKIRDLGVEYRETESIKDLKKYNARIEALRNND